MPESSSEFDSPDAFEGETPPSDMSETRGLILSRSALAKALRMDVKTVDRFIKEGAPVFRRGDAAKRIAHQIDLADFVRWWIQRETAKITKKVINVPEGEEAFDEEKRRDKAAQASLRELALERELKRVVPVADVHRYMDEISGLVRNSINAMHTQVPSLDDDQREELIKATDAVLEHIHSYVPPEADVSESDFGDDAFG
jgi:phage terminase Nu1 subunit (DNA packaging protein)